MAIIVKVIFGLILFNSIQSSSPPVHNTLSYFTEIKLDSSKPSSTSQFLIDKKQKENKFKERIGKLEKDSANLSQKIVHNDSLNQEEKRIIQGELDLVNIKLGDTKDSLANVQEELASAKEQLSKVSYERDSFANELAESKYRELLGRAARVKIGLSEEINFKYKYKKGIIGLPLKFNENTWLEIKDIHKEYMHLYDKKEKTKLSILIIAGYNPIDFTLKNKKESDDFAINQAKSIVNDFTYFEILQEGERELYLLIKSKEIEFETLKVKEFKIPLKVFLFFEEDKRITDEAVKLSFLSFFKNYADTPGSFTPFFEGEINAKYIDKKWVTTIR